MNRCQQTVRTTNVTTGQPTLEIIAGPMGCRVFAVKVVSASSVGGATELGLGRPAAQGDSPVAPTAFPGDDGGTSASKVALSWGAVPTAPAAFFERLTVPAATVGFVREWSFPQGLWIQPKRSLVLHNITGGCALDVTIDVQEQLNTTLSYADMVLRDGPIAYWRLNDAIGYEQAVLSDAPVGYWRFQEPNGTVVADASGNGHTMTLPGSHVALGVAGALANGTTGLSTDGSQTFAAMTDFASGTSLSVEFWINPAASILTYAGVLGNQAGGFGWYYDGNVRKIRVNTPAGDFINSTALTLGQLYHVVITMTGGGISFFLNGQADGTAAGTTWGSINVNAALALGGGQLSANLLDELALYNYPLSALQVANHYALRLSKITTLSVGAVGDLVGAWPATVSHGAIPGVAGATSEGGGAFQFDGATGSYIQTNAVFNAPIGVGPLSVEFWFKVPSVAAQWGIVDDKDAGSNTPGFNVFFVDAGATVDFRIANGVSQSGVNTNAGWADGKWHHFVGVLSRGAVTDSMTLYIDGSVERIATDLGIGGWNLTSAIKLRIGAYTTGGFPNAYTGILDEVAVYSKALTAQQVFAHFSAR